MNYQFLIWSQYFFEENSLKYHCQTIWLIDAKTERRSGPISFRKNRLRLVRTKRKKKHICFPFFGTRLTSSLATNTKASLATKNKTSSLLRSKSLSIQKNERKFKFWWYYLSFWMVVVELNQKRKYFLSHHFI